MFDAMTPISELYAVILVLVGKLMCQHYRLISMITGWQEHAEDDLGRTISDIADCCWRVLQQHHCGLYSLHVRQVCSCAIRQSSMSSVLATVSLRDPSSHRSVQILLPLQLSCASPSAYS